MTRTEYVTWTDGSERYRGSSLEAAARAWDAATFAGKAPAGGVAVQQYRDQVMVRDGWVLHVDEVGRVYLSPNLSDTLT